MSSVLDRIETITPTAEESDQATESSRLIATILGRSRGGNLSIRVSPDEGPGEPVVLPFQVVRMLKVILSCVARGDTFTLMPVHHEMTTNRAADFLRVSRPFLVGLLDKKEIPCRKVGTHRRVLLGDLIEYQKRFARQRNNALDELAKQAQELDMGY